ncbi:hypothetical protein Hanom_Chr11g01013611 [Helianthus anomalus]
MVDNVHGERFLQYPRFIQMLLDDQIPNLPKSEDDEIELDHMDNETLKRLNVYQGQKHLHLERSLLKVEHKKRKRVDTTRTPKDSIPKAAPKRTSKKKSPPHLVDEPDEVQPGNVNVESDAAKAAQEAEKAKNAEKFGGENVEMVEETFVEGVVHIDSSETECDIDVTQIAPTTGVSGKIRMTGPSRKMKNSDEEDASYVPTTEAEKLKKGRGIMKRKAKRTGATPRKHKIRKTTAKVVKDTIGECLQAPETVTMDEQIVQAEIHIPTPPTSPIQESILVQTEVHVTTPPQQSQNVEEP